MGIPPLRLLFRCFLWRYHAYLLISSSVIPGCSAMLMLLAMMFARRSTTASTSFGVTNRLPVYGPRISGNHLIFFLLLQIGKRLVKRRSLFCLPNHFLQNTVHCVIYKRCGIHHSRYANRNHGNPKMCHSSSSMAPIADPCARRNAGIAHLNGGVNAVGTACGKGTIAISREGCSLSTIPFTISPVSIPVIPITPGLTAATGRTAFSISAGSVPLRWRVTRILEITFGPSASGVMFQLPSPITRIQSSLFGFARERICSARSPISFSWQSHHFPLAFPIPV